MFQKIRNYLFKTVSTPEEENELDVTLAAATLMMEVSWADRTISDEEMAVSAKKLSEIFSLDNHQANALLEEGKILVEESVGLQQFTSLLNENLAADQKFSIILALRKSSSVKTENLSFIESSSFTHFGPDLSFQ